MLPYHGRNSATRAATAGKAGVDAAPSREMYGRSCPSTHGTASPSPTKRTGNRAMTEGTRCAPFVTGVPSCLTRCVGVGSADRWKGGRLEAPHDVDTPRSLGDVAQIWIERLLSGGRNAGSNPVVSTTSLSIDTIARANLIRRLRARCRQWTPISW